VQGLAVMFEALTDKDPQQTALYLLVHLGCPSDLSSLGFSEAVS
jgi:hypothetical protein